MLLAFKTVVTLVRGSSGGGRGALGALLLPHLTAGYANVFSVRKLTGLYPSATHAYGHTLQCAVERNCGIAEDSKPIKMAFETFSRLTSAFEQRASRRPSQAPAAQS